MLGRMTGHKGRQNKNMFGSSLHVQTGKYLVSVICAVSSVPFFILYSLCQILIPITAVQTLGLTLSCLLWVTSDTVNEN